MPKHLVVIGAGVIGLELGSVWRRLGAEVTVVEFLDRDLPLHDGEISKQAQRILEKQGIKFALAPRSPRPRPGKGGVTLTLEPAKGGAPQEMKADVVLVAIGRRPFTEGLGAKEAGVETRQARLRQDRQAFPHQCARHLGHRRRDRRRRCWPTRPRTKAWRWPS